MLKVKFRLLVLIELCCLGFLPDAQAQAQSSTTAIGTETASEPSVSRPDESESSQSWLSGRRRPGAYVGLGVSRANEVGNLNYYEVLYGKKENQFNFFAGYYLYSYLVDFGLGTNVAYYSARGNPVKAIPGQSVPISGRLPAETVIDKGQEIELTLIPVQVLAQLAFSPFASRRIVLRAWAGLEQLYVQESLKPKLPSDANLSSDAKTYVNRGWNSGTVYGAMISISLSGLEPRSDFALKSLGIDRTFISPFIEIVKTNDAKMGNFDRQAYGIAFNFESLR